MPFTFNPFTGKPDYYQTGSSPSGGIVSKTYAEIVVMINAATLIAGTFYYISDRKIMFQAVSTSKFSLNGIRFMNCPAIYDAQVDAYGNVWKGIWNPNLSMVIDELVIWGGQVWKNLDGNVGAPLYDTALDAEWELIPKDSFTNNEYVEILFGCQYHFINDYVTKQWDNFGNVFQYDPNIDTFLNCDISDWNYNSNISGFTLLNNTCRGCYNNSIVGGISHNSNKSVINNNYCSGEISFNTGSGMIYNNSNNGGIFNNIFEGEISDNSNDGAIEYNICSAGITTNSNGGPISTNICNYIENNSNDGNIYLNIIIDGLQDNSNDGDIVRNYCRAIASNSHLGSISENRNNGAIVNVTSVVPVNIINNINNGTISGAQVADVTDPIVNK